MKRLKLRGVVRVDPDHMAVTLKVPMDPQSCVRNRGQAALD